ncbi:hypothetical protein [Phascolarctobacterium sp.]
MMFVLSSLLNAPFAIFAGAFDPYTNKRAAKTRFYAMFTKIKTQNLLL